MQQTMSPFTAELLAEWAVQRLLQRYCVLIDSQDFAGFARLFTEDGTLDLNGNPVQGHAAIEALMRSRATGRSLHLCGAIAVDLKGDDRAQATSNVAVYKGPAGADGDVLPMAPPAALAVYRDTLRLEGGVWRIAARKAVPFMVQA